eukprot:8795752-Ditylum_brightwellii.AAC.1
MQKSAGASLWWRTVHGAVKSAVPAFVCSRNGNAFWRCSGAMFLASEIGQMLLSSSSSYVGGV